MEKGHQFSKEQIEKIIQTLHLSQDAVTSLEDDENLEIVLKANNGDDLVIYISAELGTNIVTIDVFLDDNSLDNEEAYCTSIQNDETEIGNKTVDDSLGEVLQEFVDTYLSSL